MVSFSVESNTDHRETDTVVTKGQDRGKVAAGEEYVRNVPSSRRVDFCS